MISPPFRVGERMRSWRFPSSPWSIPGLSQCLIAAFMTHHGPEWSGEWCC